MVYGDIEQNKKTKKATQVVFQKNILAAVVLIEKC